MLDVKCERCPLMDQIARIREIVGFPAGAPVRRRRARGVDDYPTDYGRLIAAAAAIQHKKLSEVSTGMGYGSDYLTRVALGTLKVTPRAARQFGPELGIDLAPYVGRGGQRVKEEPGSAPVPDADAPTDAQTSLLPSAAAAAPVDRYWGPVDQREREARGDIPMADTAETAGAAAGASEAVTS